MDSGLRRWFYTNVVNGLTVDQADTLLQLFALGFEGASKGAGPELGMRHPNVPPASGQVGSAYVARDGAISANGRHGAWFASIVKPNGTTALPSHNGTPEWSGQALATLLAALDQRMP